MGKPLAPGANAYVYVIGPSRDGLYKIGRSFNPFCRVGTLKPTEGEVAVYAYEPVSWAHVVAVERYAHWLAAERRRRGEWFDIDPEEACRVVEEAHHAVLAGKRAPKPPPPDTVRLGILMAPRTQRLVNEWRRRQPKMPSFSRAVIQIVDLALAADRAAKRKPDA